MPLYYDKMDSMLIVLNQPQNLDGSSTYNSCRFNVKVGGILQNYEKYRLYVDNFSLDTDGLSGLPYQVVCNFSQSRSYNSQTNGTNNVVATVFKSATASTDDALNYQGANSPIEIDNLPLGEIRVDIKNLEGTNYDLDSNNNLWSLTLRIDMYNSVNSEPLADVQKFNKKSY